MPSGLPRAPPACPGKGGFRPKTAFQRTNAARAVGGLHKPGLALRQNHPSVQPGFADVSNNNKN
ncbi:unnamed protein product [Prunus armeniaca]